MPTSFTAPVNDGTLTDLKQFAMKCSRAFIGSMREKPVDAPIPTSLEPSDHHLKELKRSEDELAKLLSMSLDEKVVAEADWWERRIRNYEERKSRISAIKSRYEAMLASVMEWKIPRSMESLRDFMAMQLNESIEHDCREEEPPVRGTSDEWFQKQVESIQWSIDYHRREHVEEVARAAKSNEWLRDLHESLK